MSNDDQTEYILHMAQQLGITLPPEELGRVKGVFGNLVRADAQVRAVLLTDETMAAAVFCPQQEPKK